MKVILFFTFIGVALAVETAYPTVPLSEFDCSGVEDPNLDHFYPHPESVEGGNLTTCNVFYRCVPGHTYAYRYTCNVVEEVFDESYQMCVNTWDASPPCGTMSTATAEPTNEPPTGGNGGNGFYCDNLVDGFYSNPESCNSFYVCNNDVPNGQAATPIPCPPGLVYNPEVQYCDWTYNTAPPCGTKVTRMVDGPACEDNERYECEGTTSVVVDDEDCATFYNCDVNIQRPCPSKCPPGLVYNQAAGYCDFTYNVAAPCGTQSTRMVDGPACEDNERFECEGTTSVVVDDEDCATFYNCDVNIQRPCPSKCPPGLVYNQAAGYCDFTYNVAAPCGTQSTRMVDGPACEDNERYECEGTTSVVVDDEDCATFYNCDVNIQRPCPSKCPPGLVYNQAAGYCDFTYNVAAPCGTA